MGVYRGERALAWQQAHHEVLVACMDSKLTDVDTTLFANGLYARNDWRSHEKNRGTDDEHPGQGAGK